MRIASWWWAVFLAFFALGCSGDKKSCKTGETRCDCNSDGTCITGLICISNRCVSPNIIIDGGVDSGRDSSGESYSYVDYRTTSFTESTVGDDVIYTDSPTGLIWPKGYVKDIAWQDALDYCDGLGYARKTDWRLPDIRELATLIDYGRFNPATSFPGTPFPGLPYGRSFWSSSSDVSRTQDAWGVAFPDGLVATNNKHYSAGYGVKCVRGKPLVTGSFDTLTVSGVPVVKDTATGLIWQRCAAGLGGGTCGTGAVAEYDWQAASLYCEGLDWAGYDDWRLPDANELRGLVDYGKHDPASVFPNMPGTWFWSSSERTGFPFSNQDDAWIVNFKDGDVSYDLWQFEYAVRCVRVET
jgi:hypothetical protein